MVALSGCASTPEPHPVAAQSVTVHFLSEEDWRAHTNALTTSGKTFGMPSDIGGSADWKSDPCEIYLPAGESPSRYVLSHELRHCSEGAFH